MSEAPTDSTPAIKSMDDIMALCKRRGFIYPASEIYGGVNGFWGLRPARCPTQKEPPRCVVD